MKTLSSILKKVDQGKPPIQEHLLAMHDTNCSAITTHTSFGIFYLFELLPNLTLTLISFNVRFPV